MSAVTSNPPEDTTTTQPSSQTSLDVDITLLTQLLSQDQGDDSGSADIAELLWKLEAADSLADGMEERLDGIIDNLDNLLSDLEARAERMGPTKGEGAEAAAVVEEQLEVVAVPNSGNANTNNIKTEDNAVSK